MLRRGGNALDAAIAAQVGHGVTRHAVARVRRLGRRLGARYLATGHPAARPAKRLQLADRIAFFGEILPTTGSAGSSPMTDTELERPLAT